MNQTQRDIAVIVAKLKAGNTLTPDEQVQLEAYRQRHANAEDNEFLVSQLAVTDARFWPLRRGTLGQIDEWTKQDSYRLYGVPLENADEAGERKTEERRRNRLAEAGTIEIVKGSKRPRAIGTRLTDPGDWYARAIAGRPGLRQCLAVMLRIAELVAAGRYSASWNDIRYVSELHLAGLATYDACGRWRTPVYANEFELLPAIIREWVQPHSLNAWQDCPDGGVVEFALTDAGREVIANPPAIGKLPPPDPDLAALYERVFQNNAPARCWTESEIAEERRDEWDAARRFACSIVSGSTKDDPDSKYPRRILMEKAIRLETQARAHGETNWPQPDEQLAGTGRENQPIAATAAKPPANPAGE